MVLWAFELLLTLFNVTLIGFVKTMRSAQESTSGGVRWRMYNVSNGKTLTTPMISQPSDTTKAFPTFTSPREVFMGIAAQTERNPPKYRKMKRIPISCFISDVTVTVSYHNGDSDSRRIFDTKPLSETK